MAAAPPMKGKGILYALSRITRPEILDAPTYIKWYEEDHIPETISTTGIHSGRRFLHVDPNASIPYLAMYPLADLAFTQSEEFAKIGVTSDILPGSGLAFDMAEFIIRHDSLVHVHDPTMKGKGQVRTLVAVATELNNVTSEEAFEKWYHEEQLPYISKHEIYLRSTRFKHVHVLTNKKAWALKGNSFETDAAEPEIPTWLALHEFECEYDASMAAELEEVVSAPTEKIIGLTKTNEVDIYRLEKEFGDKDWFHGQ